jgi:hypothetical protein
MPTLKDRLEKLARGIVKKLEQASNVRERIAAIEDHVTALEARN